MNNLILKAETACGWFTPLENVFIKKYMPEANGNFVKVYIYALQHLLFCDGPISNAQISKALDILESDVLKAWKYWDTKGVISLKEDGDNNFIIEFNLLSANSQKNFHNNKRFIMDTRPIYSPEEISIYISSSKDIRLLFKTAEEKLGKLLSSQDTSILFSLYDWLRLPVEVIMMLLEYCSSINKRNMRYIEKIAVDWADNEIHSVEKAEQWLKSMENKNKNYRVILSTLGIHRSPTKYETEYMDKWIKTWEFSIELILKACEITINTTNPNFKYIDSILLSWHSNNIKTVEHADIFIEEYRKKNTGRDRTDNSKKNDIKANNRFHNFTERDYDFDKIEEKILEKRLKKHSR